MIHYDRKQLFLNCNIISQYYCFYYIFLSNKWSILSTPNRHKIKMTLFTLSINVWSYCAQFINFFCLSELCPFFTIQSTFDKYN